NVHGRAILYADTVTGSMRRALDETARRRTRQVAYNAAHGITPVGIVKAVQDVMEGARSAEERGRRLDGGALAELSPEQVMKRIKKLEAEMMKLARNLEFEAAAKLRDEISELRRSGLGLTGRRAG
ncbi:MAG: UvrB/UvrC motif-containing protein, partial [Proteobacteria bacterium]|nr:UvrB/UvrC motif-containing protein [Pseudomonadota bacterium]